jgi:hypothetical protein
MKELYNTIWDGKTYFAGNIMDVDRKNDTIVAAFDNLEDADDYAESLSKSLKEDKNG